MHLPAGLFASLAQSFQESVAVLVVSENRLAAIAAIHDVVHCPGILDAQLASHGPHCAQDKLICQCDMTISLTDPSSGWAAVLMRILPWALKGICFLRARLYWALCG